MEGRGGKGGGAGGGLSAKAYIDINFPLFVFAENANFFTGNQHHTSPPSTLAKCPTLPPPLTLAKSWLRA